MPLLVGQHTNRIDRKGRVSVPKQFRDFYQARGGAFAGVYVFPSPKLAAIEGSDEQFMERIAASLDDLALFSEEQNDLATVILGSAHALPFDPEGRVVLPAELLAYAGLDGEATFVGRGNTFQIWHPDAYRGRHAEAAERVRERGATLSLRPGARPGPEVGR
ncbi:MAG: division/cell wall cluster transcriptional repressor MraZ [Rhodospirillales bacterium]|nr:division/cell wall cluster transcriptional repressor MraZ [Rhodospirillales bacterium]